MKTIRESFQVYTGKINTAYEYNLKRIELRAGLSRCPKIKWARLFYTVKYGRKIYKIWVNPANLIFCNGFITDKVYGFTYKVK
jgi:hypothetical protein